MRSAFGARQQVEGLEDETDFPVADLRQLVVIHLAHVRAVEFIQARSGRVQAAQQIHQGGFAGTGRPHDGHILAALHFNRNIAQRVDRLPAHLVAAGNVLQSDETHKLKNSVRLILLGYYLTNHNLFSIFQFTVDGFGSSRNNVLSDIQAFDDLYIIIVSNAALDAQHF